ncbi:hypothetical protein TREMEDRAFT_65698 [Tremella mesenterica DSM 1558]|uniref:uncharacterized protein n=1 Tax=Tremella mesenterica (strain ATCC 24925 / CBS 8224 / DSM 1558 / NBRC 9311 / NRRL Y-6157 / RJB 2259-6 / UBC 559-6) TaxID=578456 RepID=UPI00032CD3CC|nr:uncharacterized protein TREMEDRAFT_65698 [Tremella mesenterica DSM 1558]EIW66410.1 hypothetical protein TREMEDRAFT_65698 [Tremella mesenterica DSM 1558]
MSEMVGIVEGNGSRSETIVNIEEDEWESELCPGDPEALNKGTSFRPVQFSSNLPTSSQFAVSLESEDKGSVNVWHVRLKLEPHFKISAFIPDGTILRTIFWCSHCGKLYKTMVAEVHFPSPLVEVEKEVLTEENRKGSERGVDEGSVPFERSEPS